MKKRKRKKPLPGSAAYVGQIAKNLSKAMDRELRAHLKKIAKDPEWGAQHTKRRKK